MAELGETDDPKQLVPGNAANITATAQALRTRAGELEQAGTGLSRIDTTDGWSGPAGDAFRAKFHGQPRSWLVAGDSFLDAAAALDTYSSTLIWAQQQAQLAINDWNAAQAATSKAQTEYQAYQQQGGSQPFQDPGEGARAAAKKNLENARSNLENAGNAAATTVGTARDRAPEKPSFWKSVKHFASDVVADVENAGGEFVNALASVGNAMVNHPGDVAQMVGGVLLTGVSAAGVGASGLLDASVVFSPAGVALGGVSVVGVGVGATMAMSGASDVSRNAGGDDEVSPASTDHTGSSGESTPPTSSKWQSSDPLVGDLANDIEAEMPGEVTGVNVPAYRADGTLATDFDLETKNAVIQVKSGTGRGAFTQAQNTAAVTGKQVIVYGPNLGPQQIRNLTQAGIKVARSPAEVKALLKP